MLRQYLVKTVLALLLVSSSSLSLAKEENNAQGVHQFVESYCKIEFDGAWVPARWAIIKFGPKRKVEREYNDVLDAAVFGLGDYYPFIVVTSYDIKETKVLSPKRATAQVMYRRVAHSESNTDGGWHLVADPKDNDLVTLNLIYDKNKWYVLDPPPPRISRDWLLEYYEAVSKEAAENSPRWRRVTKVLTSLKSL